MICGCLTVRRNTADIITTIFFAKIIVRNFGVQLSHRKKKERKTSAKKELLRVNAIVFTSSNYSMDMLLEMANTIQCKIVHTDVRLSWQLKTAKLESLLS